MIPLIGSLVVTGFLGSLGHCVGMCGPLVMMMGKLISREGTRNAPLHIVYHGSRLITYTILGGIAGLVGSFMGMGSKINLLTGIISMVFGICIVVLGFINLGVLSFQWLGGKSGWITKAMEKAVHLGGLKGVMLLGALNGLLPCGLVYSAVLIAASTAKVVYGTVAMLLFGLSTLPVMFLLGLGSASLRLQNRGIWLRFAAGFIVLVGIQQIIRGLSTLHFVPPLVLGGVVIW